MKKQKIIGIMLIISIVFGTILQLSYKNKVYAATETVETDDYTINFSNFTDADYENGTLGNVDIEMIVKGENAELSEQSASEWRTSTTNEGKLKITKLGVSQGSLLSVNLTVDGAQKRYDFITPIHMSVGDRVTFDKANYGFGGENANYYTVSASSDNANVAKIEENNEGKFELTALKEGNSTITASATSSNPDFANASLSFKVTVSTNYYSLDVWTISEESDSTGLALDIGESDELILNADLKEGYERYRPEKRMTVSWYVQDPTIASVEQQEGTAFSYSGKIGGATVTGLKAGTTKLIATITTTKGDTQELQYNIKVNGEDDDDQENKDKDKDKEKEEQEEKDKEEEQEDKEKDKDKEEEEDKEDKGKVVETPEWDVLFDKSKLTLTVGDITEITANAKLKEGFEALEEPSKVFSITWKISDSSIIKVTPSEGDKITKEGKAGSAKIEALKEGKATIVVSINVLGTDTQIKVEIPVTVKAKADDTSKDDNKDDSSQKTDKSSDNGSKSKTNGSESSNLGPQAGSGVAIILLVAISIGIASIIISKKKLDK